MIQKELGMITAFIFVYDVCSVDRDQYVKAKAKVSTLIQMSGQEHQF